MNYRCTPQTAYTAVVDLIPTTKQDAELLKLVRIDNEDHEFTLYTHYSNGVRKCDAKAILVRIEDYIVFPHRALCTFEMSSSIGNF